MDQIGFFKFLTSKSLTIWYLLQNVNKYDHYYYLLYLFIAYQFYKKNMIKQEKDTILSQLLYYKFQAENSKYKPLFMYFMLKLN